MTTDLQCKNCANFLLIDTSYYIFYRYFATLRWFTFQQPKDESGSVVPIDYEGLHENEAFTDALKKHMKAEFVKLQKKWKVPSSNVIFCNDCPRADIWRMTDYSEYKAGRVLAGNFNKGVFPLIYDFLRSEGIWSVEYPGLEADDMAYIFTQKIHTQCPESRIIIITNDNDYLQMKAPHIELYNVQGKGTDLCTRSLGDPMVDLYMKICIGDKSDNIPPICAKMGTVTAEKLARMTAEERDAWIDAKGPECREQFEKNRRIISFAEIPQDLIDKVNEKYFIDLV
jgi:5'-3' exonuclease